MKVKLLAALMLMMSVGTAGAIVDISAGPYFGMNIPIVNDQAESGALWGLQAKVSVLSFVAVGAHYSSSSFGEVEHTFFEGDSDEFTDTLEGGDLETYGLDAYVGFMNGFPGLKFYLVGSIESWKWTRDYTDEVSETAFSVGPGVEWLLPFGLGIEGRGVFEFAPTDNDGSIKNFFWFVGANYHFGSLLK
jgi:hypothetical protein